jgi:hypothetical protein
MKYLEENGNGRKEGPFRVYDLFDECRDVFEWILEVIVNDKVPDSLPQLRASQLNSMVEIYAAASRLKLDKVMNVILDAFLTDINSNETSPLTLVVDIYQITAKNCGLRRWFLEQATISVDAEDFEAFVEY